LSQRCEWHSIAEKPVLIPGALFDRKRDSKDTPALSKPSEPVKETSTSTEQVVTPWEVAGQVTETGEQLGINYDKLISQFGTRSIDAELLARFKEATGHEPHIFLRRGMFFSHRRVGLGHCPSPALMACLES
jgi:hypothetical protein